MDAMERRRQELIRTMQTRGISAIKDLYRPLVPSFPGLAGYQLNPSIMIEAILSAEFTDPDQTTTDCGEIERRP
jgi:hypothetical protein